MKRNPTWCRTAIDYLAICAWAFWMGGFSFYFGVVIRIGSGVVGDSSQGFVTQGTTWWLNIAAVVALALLFASVWMSRNRYALGTWCVMVVCQVVLFVLHACLDALIDTTSQTILEREPFEIIHEWYEFTSAIQWLFAMILVGLWLVRRYDFGVLRSGPAKAERSLE